MRCGCICWDRGKSETFRRLQTLPTVRTTKRRMAERSTKYELESMWGKNGRSQFRSSIQTGWQKLIEPSVRTAFLRPKYKAQTSRTRRRRWPRRSVNHFCIEFSKQGHLTMKCTPPHSDASDIYEADAEDGWLFIYFMFLFWSSKTLLCHTTSSFMNGSGYCWDNACLTAYKTTHPSKPLPYASSTFLVCVRRYTYE